MWTKTLLSNKKSSVIFFTFLRITYYSVKSKLWNKLLVRVAVEEHKSSIFISSQFILLHKSGISCSSRNADLLEWIFWIEIISLTGLVVILNISFVEYFRFFFRPFFSFVENVIVCVRCSYEGVKIRVRHVYTCNMLIPMFIIS